jgi:ketosteroid isomerase-like protein
MKKDVFGPLVLVLISVNMLGGRAFAQKRLNLEKERATLLQTDNDFARASVQKSAIEAFALYLANDAIQLPAGANPVLGKKAILEQMGSGYGLRWEPKNGEVAKSADLGWTWGTYELHSKDTEGKTVVRHGKYVNVWRKQNDGAWKVIVDMGNASPSP